MRRTSEKKKKRAKIWPFLHRYLVKHPLEWRWDHDFSTNVFFRKTNIV
ncbi:hypothetical protein B4113_0305 [Geobacillus sp. B4113_201601]|nr:hypothetical protein B4113_0305 [Geobacillus sp. B4113_201601]